MFLTPGRRHERQTLGGERGQSLVEFALLLPFLFLVILGMVDAAKAFNYWNDETHLANEAARYAAVNHSPVTGQSIEQAIKAQADTVELRNGGGSIAGTGVTVTFCFPAGESGQVGQSLKVTVTATYKWFNYLGRPIVQQDIVAHSSMRVEKAYDNTPPYSTNAYMNTPAGPNTCS